MNLDEMKALDERFAFNEVIRNLFDEKLRAEDLSYGCTYIAGKEEFLFSLTELINARIAEIEAARPKIWEVKLLKQVDREVYVFVKSRDEVEAKKYALEHVTEDEPGPPGFEVEYCIECEEEPVLGAIYFY